MKGELSYVELNKALTFRYPAYSISELQENFNPAKVDENTLLLLRNPHEMEDFWNALKILPVIILLLFFFSRVLYCYLENINYLNKSFENYLFNNSILH
jgi:hypothetical protein